MTIDEAWEKLAEAYRALDEVFNAKYGKSRDPRACIAKHGSVQVDDGCDYVDCPVCDALSTIQELLRR